MAIARIVGLVVAALIAVAARPADACGYWKMTDVENKFDIGWLINSGEIKTKAGKRLGTLYLDIEAKDGIRVVTSKKIIYDIKNGRILRYGKPVGTFDPAGAIAFGSKAYTIEFTDQKPFHDMPSWTMTVKRGDAVIVESTEASALCAVMHRERDGATMTEAEQQHEIRRRVAYYLAWREFGM